MTLHVHPFWWLNDVEIMFKRFIFVANSSTSRGCLSHANLPSASIRYPRGKWRDCLCPGSSPETELFPAPSCTLAARIRCHISKPMSLHRTVSAGAYYLSRVVSSHMYNYNKHPTKISSASKLYKIRSNSIGKSHIKKLGFSGKSSKKWWFATAM